MNQGPFNIIRYHVRYTSIDGLGVPTPESPPRPEGGMLWFYHGCDVLRWGGLFSIIILWDHTIHKCLYVILGLCSFGFILLQKCNIVFRIQQTRFRPWLCHLHSCTIHHWKITSFFFFFTIFLVLGVEARAFTPSHIPSLLKLFLWRMGLIKLLRLGSNLQASCASASGNAWITEVCHCAQLT